jgi:hypothetical protein
MGYEHTLASVRSVYYLVSVLFIIFLVRFFLLCCVALCCIYFLHIYVGECGILWY